MRGKTKQNIVKRNCFSKLIVNTATCYSEAVINPRTNNAMDKRKRT